MVTQERQGICSTFYLTIETVFQPTKTWLKPFKRNLVICLYIRFVWPHFQIHKYNWMIFFPFFGCFWFSCLIQFPQPYSHFWKLKLCFLVLSLNCGISCFGQQAKYVAYNPYPLWVLCQGRLGTSLKVRK